MHAVRTTDKSSPGQTSHSSASDTGPALGLGIGYDFAASRMFAVGIDTRLLYLMVNESAPMVGPGWSYGRNLWVSFGLTLTVQIPVGP